MSRYLDGDLLFAMRALRKQPLVSCAAILTLSIGIAAPTVAFSLANGFISRTPANRDPGAFFSVARSDATGGVTLPQYLALRSELTSSRELVAWSHEALMAPLGTEDPARVPGLLVSCNFFRLFGTGTPITGRLLDAGDCASASPVAVLSEGTWRNRLGSNPAVVGTVVQYGGVPVTIVGVASIPSFQLQTDNPDFVAGLWMPYSSQASFKELFDLFQGRNMVGANNRVRWLELAGFLKPGVSRQAATTEFRLLEARDVPPGQRRTVFTLTDGSRWSARRGDSLGFFALALAFPILVLVAACVSVAALLLSRAVGRQREMAVRLALGASRAALVRMLLIEGLLLSAAAAFGAFLLVSSLAPLLVRYLHAELWFGAPESLAPDWPVFVCLGAFGIVAALLSTLAPAAESVNTRLTASLQGAWSGMSKPKPSRAHRVFVGIQVAACTVPLVVAVTIARTTTRITEPGFGSERLLVAEIRDTQGPGTSLSSIADRVTLSAGVESVAYAGTLPLVSEPVMPLPIRIHGQSGEGQAFSVAATVSPAYFHVFDIPILAGRSFERDDHAQGGLTPVVVSRQFARRFFGKDDVIGEVIETVDRSRAVGERMTIIGIAADRTTGLAHVREALTDGSMIYQLLDASASSGFLVVKTKGSAGAMADSLRALLHDVTGSQQSVQTFDSRLTSKVAGLLQIATLLVGLGSVCLLLAIVGVIGAVSSDANHKRKEFAIRVALGSGPWAVRQRIVESGLPPIGTGILAGLLVAWAALRVAESQRMLPLASVAMDPRPYVAVSALLLAAALTTLLAVAYPLGRRDPVAALREQ
jgi:predicted permease